MIKEAFRERVRRNEAKLPREFIKTETQLHRIKEINAFMFKSHKTMTNKNNSVQFSQR